MPLPDEHAPLLPAPLLIVEDDALMQKRLRGLLMSLGYEASALFVAGNIKEARALRGEQPFAMALIDIHLPDGSGIDLIRDWHGDDPALAILVVSAWSDSALIVSAIQAGATGYLLKQRDDGEIAQSLRAALQGGAPIDPFVARHILAAVASAPATDAAADTAAGALPAAPARTGRLTAREIEILGLVSRGLTNREIADSLCLTSETVGWYTKNIYKKLAVSTRTEAVFAARERGLLR
jgi:DNA-binding NarL/FixJ family response regulator